jgi:glutamate-ammonia-ligase adenylyltransferase
MPAMPDEHHMRVTAVAKAPQEAIRMAADFAPYLRRLAEIQPQCLDQIVNAGPDRAFADILASLEDEPSSDDMAMAALRQSKQAAHLVLSAADLSLVWPLETVVTKMTEFADAATRYALAHAARSAQLSLQGIFLIALGKMGAHELNYSSDIDIAAFYDPEIFDGGTRAPSDAAARLIKHMVHLLETRTADGYVLRTDLRLRPDPRSTPLAVSTRMAENYYESVGQNWERMVWIKARAFAGDENVAASFLDMMQSFVWRQHLDYWAINDIHAIKAMINASGDRASLERPDADLKLGAGGIREIEFFAQTQQLIFGGKNKTLRQPDTASALAALRGCKAVEPETEAALQTAYIQLRQIEHRVQMRTDEQTHTLPKDEDRRADIASLCGYRDLAEFDKHVLGLRQQVHDIYLDLFGREARATGSKIAGNLVFTGVDDDPRTVETLSGLGFEVPTDVIGAIRHWHRGHVPATRSARGRELLTALLPDLLQDMSRTGEPDRAFRNFSVFLEHLPSGVQTLSMLLAEARLRTDLIATLALAPPLAVTLGRRPGLLEALLQPGLISPPAIGPDLPFDQAMDAARIYHADRAFLIGHDLLHGRMAAVEAAQAYTELADWVVRAMARAAEAECIAKFGPPPGIWCVCAMGKLGGEAMTAGSDLDLMVLYEPDNPDDSPVWFSRFTQRLITALSAPTSEGLLYEVDMRLRPSGRSGPVAVRLSSFDRYQQEDAWTWEHMALTRLRSIADTGGLAGRALEIVGAVLMCERDAEGVRGDIHDMRLRLETEKPSGGLWDMKLDIGGLVDLEFIVQHGLLMTPAAIEPGNGRLGAAIERLTDAGWFTSADGALLEKANRFLSSLQQIQRLAISRPTDKLSAPARDRYCRAVGVDEISKLEATLKNTKQEVASIRQNQIGKLVSEYIENDLE